MGVGEQKLHPEQEPPCERERPGFLFLALPLAASQESFQHPLLPVPRRTQGLGEQNEKESKAHIPGPAGPLLQGRFATLGVC